MWCLSLSPGGDKSDHPDEKRLYKLTNTLNGINLDLQFHHFGLAVRRPDEATALVASLGYTIAKTVFDPVQNVNLTLCTTAY